MDKLFSQWIDAYQDQAWSLALHLLKDRREAEDAAQDAFIKLWQHRETMSPERVKPWLLRVLRNICLDRLRRRRDETELEDTHLSGQDSPLQGLQNSELAQRLQQAIARLAEPYRSLIILRDIHQHSYADVAGVTELSLPQVKTYLHRARRQLREELLEWQP